MLYRRITIMCIRAFIVYIRYIGAFTVIWGFYYSIYVLCIVGTYKYFEYRLYINLQYSIGIHTLYDVYSWTHEHYTPHSSGPGVMPPELEKNNSHTTAITNKNIRKKPTTSQEFSNSLRNWLLCERYGLL